MEVYDLWSKYHLNYLHAGTPEQERAVDNWEKKGNSYKTLPFSLSYAAISCGRHEVGDFSCPSATAAPFQAAQPRGSCV